MEEIMLTYKDLIFSICLKMTGDYFAAEDLAQDTFLSAYLHKSSFDGQNMKSWLCRIASNKCIDYNRQTVRAAVPSEDEVFENVASSTDDPMQEYMNKETLDEFEQCCKTLKPPYDEIAILYYVKGKSADEIAKVLNTKKKTIQTQIYRARDLLKKEYRRECG